MDSFADRAPVGHKRLRRDGGMTAAPIMATCRPSPNSSSP